MPSAFGLVAGVRWPVFAAFAYRYPLDRIIARCKRGGDPGLAHWGIAAAVLALPEALQERLAGLELLAVPARARRLRSRRSDLPTYLLERLVAGSGARRSAPARWAATGDAAQHGLASPERRTRASGRFRLAAGLSGRRLGLVDDVCTTGATLAALGEAAENAGARVEAAFVLALTDPPGLAPAQTSRFTTERA